MSIYIMRYLGDGDPHVTTEIIYVSNTYVLEGLLFSISSAVVF